MNSNQYNWWKEDENKMYQSVFSFLQFLTQDQNYKSLENFKFMRLYGNYDLTSLRGYRYNRADEGTSVVNRVTLNIVQSMVDTVVSKIGKNKPKPRFLTEGGDFTLQRQAKRLSQFIEGQFEASDFYAKAAMAFQDSCIFGTGALKIFKNNNKVCIERVFIDEIVVDDREAFYGTPRQMHQKKFIHKDVLSDMFPDYKNAIDNAVDLNAASSIGTSPNPDMVLVIESWHLKSGENAKDGKHAICISNQTLFEEDWQHDYFPFVFWRWGQRPLGFFGQGLSEQLQGLQLEINKILRTIQVSMHLVSVPKLFVEAGSKIVDAHLDNRIGSIIKFSGTPPTPGQLGIIPPELFAHLDRLYTRAYEIAGVSQLSATSQKPTGLNSGKALREYNDLETERFMSVAQRYEKCFLTAVPMIIDIVKEIDEDMDGKYAVKVKGKKFIDTIKWKDVELERDQYEMGLFPTSALSSNPSARLADVQDLVAAGYVQREDALDLLDYPDLQSYINFETASGEDIKMQIENMIDKGKYETPEPYQDLENGIKKMQQAYLFYKTQNAPEAKLELLRRWMEDAKALLERAAVDTARQQAEMQAQAQMMAQTQMEEQTAPPAELAATQAPGQPVA